MTRLAKWFRHTWLGLRRWPMYIVDDDGRRMVRILSMNARTNVLTTVTGDRIFLDSVPARAIQDTRVSAGT